MAQLMMTSAYNDSNHVVFNENHPLSRQQQQPSSSYSGGFEKSDDHEHVAANTEPPPPPSSSSSFPNDNNNSACHRAFALQQQVSSTSSHQSKFEGDDIDSVVVAEKSRTASVANVTTTTKDCSFTAAANIDIASLSLSTATANPIAQPKRQRKRTRHVRSTYVFCGNGDLVEGIVNVGRSENVFSAGGAVSDDFLADVFGDDVASSSTTKNSSVFPIQDLATVAAAAVAADAGHQQTFLAKNHHVFDSRPNYDALTSDRSVQENNHRLDDDDCNMTVMDIEKMDSAPQDDEKHHPTAQVVDDDELINDSASDFIAALQTGAAQTYYDDDDMDFVFDR